MKKRKARETFFHNTERSGPMPKLIDGKVSVMELKEQMFKYLIQSEYSVRDIDLLDDLINRAYRNVDQTLNLLQKWKIIDEQSTVETPDKANCVKRELPVEQIMNLIWHLIESSKVVHFLQDSYISNIASKMRKKSGGFDLRKGLVSKEIEWIFLAFFNGHKDEVFGLEQYMTVEHASERVSELLQTIGIVTLVPKSFSKRMYRSRKKKIEVRKVDGQLRFFRKREDKDGAASLGRHSRSKKRDSLHCENMSHEN